MVLSSHHTVFGEDPSDYLPCPPLYIEVLTVTATSLLKPLGFDLNCMHYYLHYCIDANIVILYHH